MFISLKHQHKLLALGLNINNQYSNIIPKPAVINVPRSSAIFTPQALTMHSNSKPCTIKRNKAGAQADAQPIYINGNVYNPLDTHIHYPITHGYKTRYILVQISGPGPLKSECLPEEPEVLEYISENTYLLRYASHRAAEKAKPYFLGEHWVLWVGDYVEDWKVNGQVKLGGAKRFFFIGKDHDKVDREKKEYVNVVFHKTDETTGDAINEVGNAGRGRGGDRAGRREFDDHWEWKFHCRHGDLVEIARVEGVRGVVLAVENVLYGDRAKL